MPSGILKGVRLSEDQLSIEAQLATIHPAIGDEGSVTASVAIGCVRTARQVKLVLPPAPSAEKASRDPALTKLIVQAVSLRDTLADQSAASFDELAKALGYSREHAADLLRLSYLAPDFVSAIIDGRQPADLIRTRLMKTPRLPLEWQQQRSVLGF